MVLILEIQIQYIFNVRGDITGGGFFHPKDSSGNWVNPFDYKFSGGQGGRDYYDENNGWTYRWDVQHNTKELIRMMGGSEAFCESLDQLFREPLGRTRSSFYSQWPDQTANVGQFTMANEPSMHIPYLYCYAGQPWKTQKRVRSLVEQWFRNDVAGVPGDEDGGGLSAFVVFSMIGFYPVGVGQDVYVIGSPFFPKVKLDLGQRTKEIINRIKKEQGDNNEDSNADNHVYLEIEAQNVSHDNKYIRSATFNGKDWDKCWFTYSDIENGGKFVFVMGNKANREWGTSPLPPSAEDY
ncbi:MAG: putative glycoside hydrolase family 92 protein [Streblomastix strix]|uniref:Putative glycoside hydrolase family 92 protein n=1 Tax=Streblomastix strix TaxID=222440 RepID=A0A5J4X2L6_9EUKA|nr:MAG: putative glycoside hydrolase family 92 protein [Streblomastix strix]